MNKFRLGDTTLVYRLVKKQYSVLQDLNSEHPLLAYYDPKTKKFFLDKLHEKYLKKGKEELNGKCDFILILSDYVKDLRDASNLESKASDSQKS